MERGVRRGKGEVGRGEKVGTEVGVGRVEG